MKTCSKCNAEKQIEAFSLNKRRKDGRQDWCKVCVSNRFFENRDLILQKSADYRQKNREKLRQYQSVYNAVHASKIREHSRDRRSKIKLDPIKFQRFKDQTRMGCKLSKLKHADRELARIAVKKAIKAGEIVRPEYCSACGVHCKPEAHHDSYEQGQWLSVRFLCRKCHNIHHRKYPETKTENKLTTA
jgi:hypothetical protein